MSNPRPTNYAASVEAKLKNICRKQGIDFRFILIRYAMERFLYRLSVSEYAKKFILKGGNLFIIWQEGYNFRPTIDSDFLYFGNADEAHLHEIFASLCCYEADAHDGLRFDADSIVISPIRNEMKYDGNRVSLFAYLGKAEIPLQFDIGTGDAITPPPEYADFPVLLDGAVPHLRIYSKETAIAEKFEAMVSKGMANSRMKDFYDIWLLSELFDFDYSVLCQAVHNTFLRRDILMPDSPPECFSVEFYNDTIKNTQWNAFCRKSKISQLPESFEATVIRLKTFLEPVFSPAVSHSTIWHAGKGWR